MRLSLCIAVWAAVVMMACLSFSRACGADPELDAAKRRADKLMAAPKPAVRETSSPCQKCKDKAGGCDCVGGCGCEAAAKLPPVRSIEQLLNVPIRFCQAGRGCWIGNVRECLDRGFDPAAIENTTLAPSEVDRLRAWKRAQALPRQVVPVTVVAPQVEYHPMYYPATYGGYCVPGKG
jgi:hypothetical protein